MKGHNYGLILSKGYHIVKFERAVKARGKLYLIDAYAKEDGKRIAIDCGDCPEEKLFDLHFLCSTVIHLPYLSDIILPGGI